MGLFSGGNSSSATTNITETLNTNLQGVEGIGIGGLKDSRVNITTTDHGTVERAFNLSELAVSEVGAANQNALSEALGFAEKSLGYADEAVAESLTFAQRAGENALDFAYEAGRPDSANTRAVLYVAGGVAVVLALVAVMPKQKRRRVKK